MGSTPVVALDGLDLQVQPGTVFGLLGANGAGKTTLVRILARLLGPSGGSASVLGHDVVAEPLAVRRRIGLAGQFAAVDEELTGRENLEIIGRLYRLSGAQARSRAAEVAAQGTAAELKATIGAELLVVRMSDPAAVEQAAAVLTDLACGDQPVLDAVTGEVRLAVADAGHGTRRQTA